MRRTITLGIAVVLSAVPSAAAAAARTTPSVDPAIAGGYTPAATAWPWTSFIASNVQTCTASLITPQRLLTAAHCVYAESTGKFIAPKNWNAWVDRRNTTTLLGEHRDVTGIAVNPSYTGPGTGDYDVAVMFLNAPVTDVPVAPLGTSQDWGQEYAATGCGLNYGSEPCYEGAEMGWGHTNYDHAHPIKATQLQAGLFTLGSDDYCRAMIANGFPTAYYDANTQFCMYNSRGTTCITHGDSGGPFMVYSGGQWVQIGVASHYPADHEWGQCMMDTNITAETWVAGPTIRNWITSVSNPSCPSVNVEVRHLRGFVSRDSRRVRTLRRGHGRHHRRDVAALRRAQRSLRQARHSLSEWTTWQGVVCKS